MSTKQLQAIAIGVAVLLILWGASELWLRRKDSTTVQLRLPALSASAVDTVAITRGADTVRLVKQSPGAWTVNRYPASQAGIEDLFRTVRDSVTPELVAESPSSFARMGVDSSRARLVRLVAGGKTLAQVLVGDPSPGYDAAYVRFPGDVRVYRWPGRLPTLVGRPVDDWRDHQIGAVVPESIATVEIQRAGKRITLRKHGTRWVLSSGAPADSAAVTRFLEHFRTVSAAGFATERQADSLRAARPKRRISVRGTGDRPLLALTFDSTASGYWVRKPEGGAVYRLDFWQVDQLTPAEDALKPHS
jgi:Domain of unknown function (DUF4340)